MNFDPEALKRMSETDKGELYRKIDEVSRMFGVDPGFVKQMIGDTEDIKQKLESLSEDDIRRMTSGIDPKVLNKLNRRKEGKNG